MLQFLRTILITNFVPVCAINRAAPTAIASQTFHFFHFDFQMKWNWFLSQTLILLSADLFEKFVYYVHKMVCIYTIDDRNGFKLKR